MAGHVRFELRNVVANYAFEKSRRFAGNQPNSGHGDHSRLSCGAGDTQLGPDGQHPEPSRTRWSKDDPAAAKPATPLRSLRWTFRAKKACVVITDAEPDRLAPLTPPAPMGLRGAWVVAARCCASPPARCCVNSGQPVRACEGFALIIRYRDQGIVVPTRIDLRQVPSGRADRAAWSRFAPPAFLPSARLATFLARFPYRSAALMLPSTTV